MTREEDGQSLPAAARPVEGVLSRVLENGDCASRDDPEFARLWHEMDGLKQSPAYAALLGEPSWRERLVALRAGLSMPSWRIALPLVPAGAAAAIAAYLWMPGRAPTQYETGVQAREVVLPDQSVVALAPRSSLAFEIADGRRIATLTGTARFSVAHDTGRPFIVKVGDAQVRVVGTRFTLSHRQVCTQLSVLSGTVDMSSPSMPPRRLNAGEEAVTVDHGGSYRLCGDGDGAAPPRWSYIDAPLSTVLGDVGRFSTRKLVIRAPEIAAERVTMAFKGDEIETIIDLIPEIVEARIAQGADGTVYIDRKH